MAPKPDSTLAPNNGGLQPPSKSPKGSSLALPGKAHIRKPGVEWDYADDIDDGQDEALDMSEEEKELEKSGEAVEKRSPSGGQVIDLLDIARPAKPKGVAKDYEVIQGSPRIIALPDEPLVPAVKEEEWEKIDEDMVEPPKSYSAVVRDSDDRS